MLTPNEQTGSKVILPHPATPTYPSTTCSRGQCIVRDNSTGRIVDNLLEDLAVLFYVSDEFLPIIWDQGLLRIQ